MNKIQRLMNLTEEKLEIIKKEEARAKWNPSQEYIDIMAKKDDSEDVKAVIDSAKALLTTKTITASLKEANEQKSADLS